MNVFCIEIPHTFGHVTNLPLLFILIKNDWKKTPTPIEMMRVLQSKATWYPTLIRMVTSLEDGHCYALFGWYFGGVSKATLQSDTGKHCTHFVQNNLLRSIVCPLNGLDHNQWILNVAVWNLVNFEYKEITSETKYNFFFTKYV